MPRAVLTIAAVVVAALHHPRFAHAQGLERRVQGAVPAAGGTVILSFAAREGVCGDGATLVAEGLGPNELAVYHFQGTTSGSFGEISGIFTTTDGDLAARCRPGPVLVALDLVGGRVTAVRTAVGARRRAGASGADLGTVSAAEAAAYLMSVAPGMDERQGRFALLAANIADSARLVPPLLGLARDRGNALWLREGALRWLARAADRGEGTPALDAGMRAIAADARDEPAVRERAVRVLPPTPENDAFLRSLYAGDAPTDLRERIIRVLAEHRGDANASWIEGLATRDDEPLGLRERAVRVLAEEMGRPERVRALYPRLREPALRERALRATAEGGGADAARWLRQVAEDRQEHQAVRERAVRLLGERGDVAYLRALYPRLDAVSLRERVLRSVGERRDEEARAFLRTVALDANESSGLRERAVRVIAESGATGAELARLYDAIPDQTVRVRLVNLLAERGDREAIAKLRAIATSDPDAEVRRRAVRKLAERE